MGATIETPATSVTLADGIVTIRSKGVHSTLGSVEQTFAAVRELVGDDTCPLLFDARQWPGGDPQAWVKVIETLGEMFTAVAMMIDIAATADVGPFPKLIDRLVVPYRIFEDEDAALDFLREQLPAI